MHSPPNKMNSIVFVFMVFMLLQVKGFMVVILTNYSHIFNHIRHWIKKVQLKHISYLNQNLIESI